MHSVSASIFGVGKKDGFFGNLKEMKSLIRLESFDV
jgi:hypothetical protein